MAYLAATVLEAFTLAYSDSNLDSFEHRKSQYGILDAFQKGTNGLFRADILEAARANASRTTQIPVINKKTFTSAAARTCTLPTNSNVSAVFTPSWTTIMTGFHMIPSQYGNNHIAYQDDFNKKMLDMQLYLLNTLDAAAYTYLNTYIAQHNHADGNPWTVTSNVMQVPKADHDIFFNESISVLAQNDLFGNFEVVASPRAAALVGHLTNQGAANSTNYAYQFGPFNFHYSNNVTVDSGSRDTVFLMPENSLGFLSWIDPDARMGNKAGDGKEWSRITLPMLGFEVGLLYQSSCGDNATEGGSGSGLEASMVEKFAFSFDYAFAHAYNSSISTLPGTIYKASLLNT